MNQIKYILFAVFTVAFSIVRAQCQLSISGQVTDLDDGSELGNCVITIEPQRNVMMTDRHGRFAFADLCPDTYSILVQHFGCRDTVITIRLIKSVKLNVKLPHSSFELSEVDVMDKRAEMKNTQNVNELSGSELGKTKGLSLGEALKSVNGVTSFNTGATISRPMIHGMQGYRVLILNNGIRQEGQQWGNEHAPEIDPFIARKISVIKGAYSIRYGSDALGGVILVEPGDLPDTAGVVGEFNAVGFSNGKTGAGSGMLEGNFDFIKGLSWRVQGTYKRGGNIRTPDYFLANTGVEEKNFSYTLGYHYKKAGAEIYYSQFNSHIGIFKGAHAGNLSDLQNAYKRNKPVDSLATFSYEIGKPNQDIAHELIKGNAHYHFASRWRLKTQYAWQYNIRKEYDLHVPLSQQNKTTDAPDLDYRITTQTAEALVEHDNIRSFRGQIGLNYMYQENVYLGRFFIPNFRNKAGGVFLTERFVKQHFEAEAGIRYDQKTLESFYYKGSVLQTPVLQFSNVTYNTGVIWKPDSTFNLFCNLGTAWRAPAPNELYSNGIHHGVGSIERGKEDLKTEKVYNATITGILKRKLISAEVSCYLNEFTDYIFLEPSGKSELTIRGAFPVFNYRQTNARISGIDAQATINILKNFSLTAKGMMVRGINTSLNDWLIYMPADRAEIQVKYLFEGKKLFRENSVQINVQFVDKQYRVPAQSEFAPPPGAYTLAGIDAGTCVAAGRQKIYFGISLTNLLDVKYRDYLDRFRYFADSPGRSVNFRIRIPIIIYDKK